MEAFLAQQALKFKGLAPHAADLADPAPEPSKMDQDKGPCAFPSSRLDSHRNFEQFRLGYMDFHQFPTRMRPPLLYI